LFQQQIKSTLAANQIRSMVVPLTDGENITFLARFYALTENYNGGEYESDVNFLEND